MNKIKLNFPINMDEEDHGGSKKDEKDGEAHLDDKIHMFQTAVQISMSHVHTAHKIAHHLRLIKLKKL